MSTTTPPATTDTRSEDPDGSAGVTPTTPTDSAPPAEPVTPEQALKAAKPPVGSGLSPVFGQLVALMLIALGVVGVQEAVYRSGLVETSWTSWVLDHLSNRTASFTVLVLCVILVLIGLALLVVVFRPRPRRALTVSATTGVYLRAGDLARLASDRVDGADGITDVQAGATRRKLTIRVSTVTPPAANSSLKTEVEDRVAPLFDALASAPRLIVDIDNQELT